MIHTLREAFNELLEDNIWMDDETRRVAREKADAMNERIGYPDMLEDKQELEAEFRDVSGMRSFFLFIYLFSSPTVRAQLDSHTRSPPPPSISLEIDYGHVDGTRRVQRNQTRLSSCLAARDPPVELFGKYLRDDEIRGTQDDEKAEGTCSQRPLVYLACRRQCLLRSPQKRHR
jgi:hypothetical protein